MSKSISNHFYNTTGFRAWNTSIVWEHIAVTQDNYGGTDLPRSFNVDTPHGTMWTSNNATKHMHEAILSVRDFPLMKDTNPKLFTQFILYEYWRSLQVAVKNGIQYRQKIYSGNWEFVFAKPRKPGDTPAVIHAKFTGLS